MNAPWVEHLGWTLTHFLWQGALIAAAYAVARRSRTPQLRYFFACAALAAMVTAPVITYIATTPASAAANPYVGTIPESSAVAASAYTPVTGFSPATRALHNDIMPWLVLAWFAGATIFWIRLTGAWIIATRMRSMLVRPAPREWQVRLNEIAASIRVSRPVKLIVSAAVQVPTVVGWLRPVVLMPVAALAGLPTEHIEALLAHELAHIRRHDYLVNILQSIAEALLFYHPAVWWISSQLRNERELCCDDEAVAFSSDTVTYVRALASLESYRPAHFNPALAASGGSLADRIARLLGHSRKSPRTMPGSGILFAGALLAITSYCVFAQPSLRPSFEVASIKPSPPEYIGFQSYVKGERYTAMTATVRNLVAFAYSIRDFQISGGPAWSGSAAYNVSATMRPGATPTESKLMLQNLLADRFHLKFHRITKKRSGYALVIDKNGPKLTESKNPGPGLGLGRGNLNGRGADMGQLAKELSSQLESPIADRTRLTALYDFTLKWTSDVEAGDSSGSSIFTAIRDQLGLRLDAVKNVPVDILVIDAVEKPTEN